MACLISLPGSCWLGGWPPIDRIAGNHLVCCCFDFVAPGSERPDHAPKSQESPERRRTAKGNPSRSIDHHNPLVSSFAVHLFTLHLLRLSFCQVFYYIYVVSISARSTLEYSELKDDPYLTQTALQYTLHSFDSQYFDIDIWITFYSTRLPSSRHITTITIDYILSIPTILQSSPCPPLALTEMATL